MKRKYEYFRHNLLFYFRKGKNASQAAKAIRDIHCRNWFDTLRFGDFSLKDERCSGRPNELDDEQIKAIIESDRHVTVGEIEEMLKIPKSTIDRPIQRL